MSVDDILGAQSRGEISPQIALARLILAGERVDGRMLAAAPAVAALAERHRERIPQLLDFAGRGLSNRASLESVGALYDGLAEQSPEAAVAFYSLGDPAELLAATAELIEVVERWSPPRGRRIIDVGCGIGRLAIPLADAAERVLGVDLSGGMVAEARRRAGERPNLRFEQVAGVSLPVEDAGADLVLVVDCLPYVVDAGRTEAFVAEAARVLAPGGDLIVFNWSYRGDLLLDIREATELGIAHGLGVLRTGEHPFRIWDAAGFQLRRVP